MDATAWTMLAAAVAILAAVVPVLMLFSGAGDSKKRKPLPPGSFGLPIIGQTLSFLGALRANTGEEWLRRWTAIYGPVFRLSMFNRPTAILVGAPANKFIFSSTAVTPISNASMARMVGHRTIRDVSGEEHRRLRAMVVQFLRPDTIKRRVATMDDEVRRHLDAVWRGRDTVAVMPSMKTLTFDVMCTVFFGLSPDGDSAVRRVLATDFQLLVRGILAVPLDLPFTTFHKCLTASQRGRRIVAGIIEERRAKLASGKISAADDVVNHMLAEGLPDEETIDNIMFLMIAAHDTTASLLTFLLRHLEANQDAYAKVADEQAEVARGKAPGEALTWEDLGRMRYTWAAALETLRLVPPLFSVLRETTADVEYGGYRIPKGWQVIQPMSPTQWDPAIFPEPQRFEPARFQNASAVPPFCFIPFGGGARVCPGVDFAKVETLVAVHYIVTRFRWKLAAGCDGSFSRFPLPTPAQGLLFDIQPIEPQTNS
ncbi:hypothetical protein ACP4OV_026977 [Aristida adscensionis]